MGRLHAIFGIALKKPQVSQLLPLLSHKELRRLLRSHHLPDRLPEPRLARLVDQEGNTLLHKAMQKYWALSEDAQRQVHLLCLLSDLSARNCHGQTPEDCLKASLESELQAEKISRDMQVTCLARISQYLARGEQQMVYMTPEWDLVVSTADRAQARAEQVLQVAEEKDQQLFKLATEKQVLESQNSQLITEKTGLEVKNADLEAQNQRLTQELERLTKLLEGQPVPGPGHQSGEEKHRFSYR